MDTVTYERVLRFPEHADGILPRRNRHLTPENVLVMNEKRAIVERPNLDSAFHLRLLKQALMRTQVQSAIYQLISGNEACTGSSVVRVDFQPNKRQVLIEATPARLGQKKSKP
jgi:hypothetical protein